LSPFFTAPQILPFAFSAMNFPALFRFLLLALLSVSGVRGEPAAPPPVAPAPTDGSYVLRPNDDIRLEVYEEADLSTSVRILKTGEASFPLIGSVAIGGLSVNAAATKIRELFAKDYLVDPKITLAVLNYATDYISVIGAVRSPGQIPIPVAGNLDLATAMATVGGPTETADSNRIQLVRAAGASSTYTMTAILSGESGRVALASGDRIIVNQSAFVGKSVNILGQVARQGPVAFPVNGQFDLVNAIALAGGLTNLANPKKITINRKGKVTLLNYTEISQRGERPYLLQPDDIVIVAERVF
jgi:polysaccharide export outer membrane protein